jgi:hypothetical protein
MMSKLNLKKMVAPVAGVSAAGAAFVAAALGAPVVLGQSAEQNHAPHDGGPVTPQVVVASGDAQQFGRWEILSAQDANEAPCLDLRLLDAADGLPESTGGCGVTADNQVMTVTGEKGTLYWGRVNDRGDSVAIRSKGKEKKGVKTFKGKDNRTYVVTQTAEALPDAEVALLDASQGNLGAWTRRRWPRGPGAEVPAATAVASPGRAARSAALPAVALVFVVALVTETRARASQEIDATLGRSERRRASRRHQT